MSNIRHVHDGFTLTDNGLTVSVRGRMGSVEVVRRGYHFRRETGGGIGGRLWETATIPTDNGALCTEESDSGISVVETIRDRFGHSLADGRRSQFGSNSDFSGSVVLSPRYIRDGGRTRLRGDRNYFSCYEQWLHAAMFALAESETAEVTEPVKMKPRYAMHDAIDWSQVDSYAQPHGGVCCSAADLVLRRAVDPTPPPVVYDEASLCMPAVAQRPISDADLQSVYNRLLTANRNGN